MKNSFALLDDAPGLEEGNMVQSASNSGAEMQRVPGLPLRTASTLNESTDNAYGGAMDSTDFCLLSSFSFDPSKVHPHYQHVEGVTCGLCAGEESTAHPISPVVGGIKCVSVEIDLNETLCFVGSVCVGVMKGCIKVNGVEIRRNSKKNPNTTVRTTNTQCPPLEEPTNTVELHSPPWNPGSLLVIEALEDSLIVLYASQHPFAITCKNACLPLTPELKRFYTHHVLSTTAQWVKNVEDAQYGELRFMQPCHYPMPSSVTKTLQVLKMTNIAGKTSLPSEGIANMNVQCRLEQLDHFENSVLKSCFSTFEPILYNVGGNEEKKKLYQTISLTQEWNQTVQTLVQTSELNCMIIGPRNSGKSTFVRTQVNSLLNTGKKVVLIDCDPGQTELGPPGVLVGTLITEPLTGPPLMHGLCPVGESFPSFSITPGTNPLGYLTAAKQCYQQVQKLYMNDPNTAVVVNTCGWTTGIGKMCLAYLLRMLQCKQVVELTTSSLLQQGTTGLTNGLLWMFPELESLQTPISPEDVLHAGTTSPSVLYDSTKLSTDALTVTVLPAWNKGKRTIPVESSLYGVTLQAGTMGGDGKNTLVQPAFPKEIPNIASMNFSTSVNMGGIELRQLMLLAYLCGAAVYDTQLPQLRCNYTEEPITLATAPLALQTTPLLLYPVNNVSVVYENDIFRMTRRLRPLTERNAENIINRVCSFFIENKSVDDTECVYTFLGLGILHSIDWCNRNVGIRTPVKLPRNIVVTPMHPNAGTIPPFFQNIDQAPVMHPFISPIIGKQRGIGGTVMKSRNNIVRTNNKAK